MNGRGRRESYHSFDLSPSIIILFTFVKFRLDRSLRSIIWGKRLCNNGSLSMHKGLSLNGSKAVMILSANEERPSLNP